jgi:LruC domain-containing protein
MVLNTTAMKKLLVYTYLMGLINFQAFAQGNAVENDAELGSREKYWALCWSMGAITASDSKSTLINGDYSFRTNQLTNSSNDATWMKSPWIKMEKGEISFVTRLDGSAGGNRGIIIQYIPFDPKDEKYGEGEEVKFDSFDFPNPINKQTTVHKVTSEVPEELIGKTVKIFLSFVGTGGRARAGLDDLSIPGKYVSDPSSNCFPKEEKKDTDSDGVADEEDDYPEDKNKAYNNYLTPNGFGTLMFEDLWPAKGDYDFNDLVLDYRINRVTNAGGEVVEVLIDILPRAAGAGYSNGFGIEFTGISPTRVEKIEGTKISSGSIHEFMSNGLEEGNKHATIIAFDKANNVLTHPGGGAVGINTDPKFPVQAGERMRITMHIRPAIMTSRQREDPIKLSDLTMENFNPFLIVNQNRKVEVHLPGKLPTAHADESLFGTKDDNSNGEAFSYYKGKDNGLPWGLNVTQSIPYMVNKVDITKGYKLFYKWAATGGEAHQDWYVDKGGYRENKVLLNAK